MHVYVSILCAVYIYAASVFLLGSCAPAVVGVARYSGIELIVRGVDIGRKSIHKSAYPTTSLLATVTAPIVDWHNLLQELENVWRPQVISRNVYHIKNISLPVQAAVRKLVFSVA